MPESLPQAAPPRVEEGATPPGAALPFAGECRYLLSLDYDGTLRQAEGPPVPPAFFELMRRWRPLGLRWGINTGRSLPYLMGDLLPCSPFLPDFVCTCERYVYMADAAGRLRPEQEHNRICERANLLLRRRFVPLLQELMLGISAAHPQLQWEYAARDPLSIEAADPATMDALAPLLACLPQRHPELAIQRAGRYLRFSDARFNKGTALEYVCKAWQLPPRHIMMMGDGHNDLDAFRRFGEAFCAAPADAHPEVKLYLRLRGAYVSPCPGVMEALRHSPLAQAAAAAD